MLLFLSATVIAFIRFGPKTQRPKFGNALKVYAHVLTPINIQTKLNPMVKNVVTRLHKYVLKLIFFTWKRNPKKTAKELDLQQTGK